MRRELQLTHIHAQTLNETTLNFTLPDGFAGEAKGSHSVKGSLFAETSFISE